MRAGAGQRLHPEHRFLVMFKVTGEDRIEGQKVLASLIMSPEFQETFNLAKGSIPARVDVSLDALSTSARSARMTI